MDAGPANCGRAAWKHVRTVALARAACSRMWLGLIGALLHSRLLKIATLGVSVAIAFGFLGGVSAAGGDPPATRPAPVNVKLQVFLADFEIPPGATSKVVVSITNRDDAPIRVWSLARCVVSARGADGSWVDLNPRPSAPSPQRPARWTGNDAPADGAWIVVEVECANEGQQVPQVSGGAVSTAVDIVPVPPHNEGFRSRIIPDWALTRGECKVRALLVRGDTVLAESEPKVIRVR